jgi:hypothetical protein
MRQGTVQREKKKKETKAAQRTRLRVGTGDGVGGGREDVGGLGVSMLRDAFLNMQPYLNPGKRQRAEASIFSKVPT